MISVWLGGGLSPSFQCPAAKPYICDSAVSKAAAIPWPIGGTANSTLQDDGRKKQPHRSCQSNTQALIRQYYIYWRRHARGWGTSHVCAFLLFGAGTIAQARRRLNRVVSILCWIDCDLHNQIYRSWSWPRTCLNMQQQREENLLLQTSKAANQTTTEQ